MDLKTKLENCKYKWQAESIIDNLTNRDIDYYNKCTCSYDIDKHSYIFSLTDYTCKIVYKCPDKKYTIQTY